MDVNTVRNYARPPRLTLSPIADIADFVIDDIVPMSP